MCMASIIFVNCVGGLNALAAHQSGALQMLGNAARLVEDGTGEVARYFYFKYRDMPPPESTPVELPQNAHLRQLPQAALSSQQPRPQVQFVPAADLALHSSGDQSHLHAKRHEIDEFGLVQHKPHEMQKATLIVASGLPQTISVHDLLVFQRFGTLIGAKVHYHPLITSQSLGIASLAFEEAAAALHALRANTDQDIALHSLGPRLRLEYDPNGSIVRQLAEGVVGHSASFTVAQSHCCCGILDGNVGPNTQITGQHRPGLVVADFDPPGGGYQLQLSTDAALSQSMQRDGPHDIHGASKLQAQGRSGWRTIERQVSGRQDSLELAHDRAADSSSEVRGLSEGRGQQRQRFGHRDGGRRSPRSSPPRRGSPSRHDEARDDGRIWRAGRSACDEGSGVTVHDSPSHALSIGREDRAREGGKQACGKGCADTTSTRPCTKGRAADLHVGQPTGVTGKQRSNVRAPVSSKEHVVQLKVAGTPKGEPYQYLRFGENWLRQLLRRRRVPVPLGPNLDLSHMDPAGGGPYALIAMGDHGIPIRATNQATSHPRRSLCEQRPHRKLPTRSKR